MVGGKLMLTVFNEWKNGVELLNVGSEFVHLNDGSGFGVYHVSQR